MSEAQPDNIRRAHAVHPVAALQGGYPLWTRDIEAEILPTIRELGIGLLPYSPQGRGFLTGTVQPGSLPAEDFRACMPRFQAEAGAANLRLVDSLKTLAACKGCTPAQLPLAWVRHHGENMVPILGTRRIERLDENLDAADIVLDADDLAAFEQALPADQVVGARY